jgi:hypothetical protein
MQEKNPARSGDKKAICWMTKGHEDFYYEDYRTPQAQQEIIRIALGKWGEELRTAAKDPSNLWERNVSVYLSAVESNSLSALRVPELRADAGVTTAVLSGLELQTPVVDDVELKFDVEEIVVPDPGAKVRLSPEAHLGGAWLCPRAQSTFYGTILATSRLWQRPPHDNCTRCNQYDEADARMRALTEALGRSPATISKGPGDTLVEEAGGKTAAWAELRSIQDKYQDLLQHVTWKAEQRIYLKTLENALQKHQALLQLDYGGFTDSNGKKVSAWSVTVLTYGREPEHYDFLFDAGPGAKKDGRTGAFFLDELFGTETAPEDMDGSLFSVRYPDVTQLVFSGDTGNGYRSYPMLENLSRFCEEHGYQIKLIPLAPGHAWNRTDSRIAHMNTLLNALKRKSRVFGAEEIARAFQLASDPAVSNKRKFMARSYVFFRVVVLAEADRALRANFKPAPHAEAMNGQLGVKSLLYFDFSVKSALNSEDLENPPGYARVREHANPSMPNNPTFLFTWRKDFCALMCQTCSDLAVNTHFFHTLSYMHKYIYI